MRRLIAHNGLPFIGGGEIWTVRLLQGLESRGYDVEMWVRDASVRDQVRAMGVRAEVVHLGGQLMIPEALAFAWKLRKRAPDALLLTTFKKSWLGGMGAGLAGVPRVVLRIGLETDLPRRHWTYRVALTKWIHYVVANSSSIRSDVAHDLTGIEADRVRTIWNGVRPPDPGRVGALRRELDLPQSVSLVGTVGRLVRDKGQDRLIRAIVPLPDVHCVLAGEGPNRTRLEELARSSGVGDRIHFLGHRDDVGVVLAGLDVYAVTSSVEGLSNSMLEAMALGVPILSTPVSGAADALEPFADGTFPGLVVHPDPEEVVAVLGRLLADAQLRAQMSEAGRRRVQQRFDADARLDDWEEILFGGATSSPS